jgi:hypothetical protein
MELKNECVGIISPIPSPLAPLRLAVDDTPVIHGSEPLYPVVI